MSNRTRYSQVLTIHRKNYETRENFIKKILKGDGIAISPHYTTMIARDGTETKIDVSFAPIYDKNRDVIGGVLVFRDVTEKKKMEEDMAKMRKLESLGILAGGIAHDFNNLLAAIIGNISFAMISVNPEQEIFNILDEAKNASLRAKNLTQQLLTFSKGGMLIKKAASVLELIKETTNFILSGSNVRCEISSPDDLWLVEIDEGQMSQVINDLIINAVHAMPEGGIVKIHLANIRVEAEDTLPLKEGKHIKISIEDKGVGISKGHINKIFDPYFTTKQKGSGLGLTTAYSIIAKHGGYISVESKLDIGTTFHIYLPVSDKQIPVKKHPENKLVTGKGKILFMDDEEMIRTLAEKTLKQLGYEVCFAEDGVEAISRYKEAGEAGEPFDAVIMDLTIPGGMGGKETIKKLFEIDPHVRAIVSSGYSNDPIMAEYKKYGFSAMLEKPYRIEKLSRILHDVIAVKSE